VDGKFNNKIYGVYGVTEAFKFVELAERFRDSLDAPISVL